MIALQLKRGSSPLRVSLPLPATPAAVDEAYSRLDSISTAAATKIAAVTGDVPNLSNYLAGKEIDGDDMLSKLNALGERIESMTVSGRQMFAGALDSESINGLDDVLRIAGSLGAYTMIDGVSNDRELGIFLVDNGYKSFPEQVMPYLDFSAIGAEYYAEHGGAYTSAGYVLRKESCNLPQRRDDAIFRLDLHSGENRTFRLELPADEAELERAKRQLQVEDFVQCEFMRSDYIPYLSELVPNDCISVEETNELARRIQEMRQTDGELMKYLSVLSVEQPDTFHAALELAAKLDDYERVPANAEEYGREVLRRIGADDELLDTIDGYMDFAGLGEASMEEDNVRRTEFGLIRRCSEPFGEEKQLVGRLTYANGEVMEYTDKGKFLTDLKEELEFRATTGMEYEILTDDPALRKAVDDAIYDLYGEENPSDEEDYGQQSSMQMGGMM